MLLVSRFIVILKLYVLMYYFSIVTAELLYLYIKTLNAVICQYCKYFPTISVKHISDIILV